LHGGHQFLDAVDVEGSRLFHGRAAHHRDGNGHFLGRLRPPPGRYHHLVEHVVIHQLHFQRGGRQLRHLDFLGFETHRTDPQGERRRLADRKAEPAAGFGNGKKIGAFDDYVGARHGCPAAILHHAYQGLLGKRGVRPEQGQHQELYCLLHIQVDCQGICSDQGIGKKEHTGRFSCALYTLLLISHRISRQI
jgi:hypothetical protein